MTFDIIVLCLAGYALLRVRGPSNLWKLLWLDGLCWFAGKSAGIHPELRLIPDDLSPVACALYIACTVIATLAFSTIVTITVANFAAIICSIVACRSFVRVYMTTTAAERCD